MEYFTADTYKNWIRIGNPFLNEKGNLVTRVKEKCDRCTNGIYVARVENGHIVPHPNAGGVCFQCGGTGWTEKTVRLYTEKEKASMDKTNEKRNNKRKEERENQMLAEAQSHAALWRRCNGISEEGYTYVITGDSYSIKDELKANGWIYSPALRWHSADPAGYEDRVVKLDADFLQIEYAAWGQGFFPKELADKVQEKLNSFLPPSKSEWIGAEGEKIKELSVTLVRHNTYSGFRGGLSNVFTFETKEGNVLTWFTSTFPNIEIGDELILSGTIKKLDEYKGIKSTVLSRCRIKAV